ncbi:MAG: methyltransferase domain-containing protein [Acidobacteriota bacterium]
MKKPTRSLPRLGNLARQIRRALSSDAVRRRPFPGSAPYWENRYARGRHSGPGSLGQLAEFKAGVINRLVAEHRVESVLEFGCGDGSQLRLACYPTYIGFDVSPTALSLCKKEFAADPGKTFKLMEQYRGETADLTLSLDVVYHLVEDEVFEPYMRRLFQASRRLVAIYSSDTADRPVTEEPHIRHRNVTGWIRDHQPGWQLIEQIPNPYPFRGDPDTGSFADFFIYRKG